MANRALLDKVRFDAFQWTSLEPLRGLRHRPGPYPVSA